MSNLTVRPETLLTQDEQKLTSALANPKAMDLSPQQKDAATISLIANVYANINEKYPDKSVLSKMKSDLRELIDTEFKSMTLEEIKIALDWGSDKWEGHGLSSKLIKNWVRTWRTSKKLEIQKSISIKKSRIKSEVQKKFTDKEKLNSIQKQFEGYLRGERISTYVYVFMKDFNLLNDVKMVWSKVDEACKQYYRETKENKNALLSIVRAKRLEEIEGVQNRTVSKIPDYIENRSKQLVIKHIFDELIEFEQTPKDLIKL